VSEKIKRWRENFSTKPTPHEYEIAEWFLRIYDGRTQDDVAELLAEYRAELEVLGEDAAKDKDRWFDEEGWHDEI
jgi:hypothetical protein